MLVIHGLVGGEAVVLAHSIEERFSHLDIQRPAGYLDTPCTNEGLLSHAGDRTTGA